MMIGRGRALVTAAWWVAAASQLAAAQRATPQPPPRHDTEILMLGTAGGPPLRADRSEPATLLIVDGRPYLVDCGIGTARRLAQAGVPSQTIGAIFFTHLHADHALGLSAVLADAFGNRDKQDAVRPLAIYGPPQTRALVDAAWNYIRIPYAVHAAEQGTASGGLPARNPFAAHEIDSGIVYSDSLIRVLAVENSHYRLMPAAARAVMKSYSYRIETPHGVVVFTGDTGPSDAVARLARGADVLVAQVGDSAQSSRFANRTADQNHWSPERRKQFLAHFTDELLDFRGVGEIASAAHVGAILLYHMNPPDPAGYVAGVQAHFAGPVFAGADLDRYCLTASAVERASGAAKFGRCGQREPSHSGVQ
ncbi:MAG TPA: MBL fold metallo-hydrolase [Gemmatimonadaceae bacterium]|nr:MBL fold metallo-hydrolase [Gemmatimonadaceae bacterium]